MSGCWWLLKETDGQWGTLLRPPTRLLRYVQPVLNTHSSPSLSPSILFLVYSEIYFATFMANHLYCPTCFRDDFKVLQGLSSHINSVTACHLGFRHHKKQCWKQLSSRPRQTPSNRSAPAPSTANVQEQDTHLYTPSEAMDEQEEIVEMVTVRPKGWEKFTFDFNKNRCEFRQFSMDFPTIYVQVNTIKSIDLCCNF